MQWKFVLPLQLAVSAGIVYLALRHVLAPALQIDLGGEMGSSTLSLLCAYAGVCIAAAVGILSSRRAWPWLLQGIVVAPLLVAGVVSPMVDCYLEAMRLRKARRQAGSN